LLFEVPPDPPPAISVTSIKSEMFAGRVQLPLAKIVSSF
jgi:hypothetical protein